ncbi:nuclear transport factor 2 family protein [Rhizobium sp. GCM10022189]|uniref:nuclear transport factor 2 family protein n=1 Tax=Rhizobium sp. GCM10022189 TaxID=3252654 RepID=UPI003605D207
MSPSRRTLLAAGATGLASLAAGLREARADMPPAERLARLSEEANGALLRGEVDAYRALVPRTQDFTLMSPFGGTPSHEAGFTEKTWEGMKTFFRNGVLKQELVAAYAGTDMVALAVIERANVEVGGLPAQDWALRVTLVYRREQGEWRLAHRHADPISHAITLQQSAALARGAAS